MKLRSFLFIALAVCGLSAAAQTGATTDRTKSKVGVNTQTPTENLDVNGTMRVRTLPENAKTNAISTKADGTGSTAVDQKFEAKYVVTADANGVLGKAPGAQPIFFYMPSIAVPTTAEQVSTTTGTVTSYNAGTQTFTIDLYQNYAQQFGLSTATASASNRVVSNASAPALPGILDKTKLDYFVTYYDPDVFEQVRVDQNGILTYKVKQVTTTIPGATPGSAGSTVTGPATTTAKTFMNIVLLTQ